MGMAYDVRRGVEYKLDRYVGERKFEVEFHTISSQCFSKAFDCALYLLSFTAP
jgi:hypothetical protein